MLSLLFIAIHSVELDHIDGCTKSGSVRARSSGGVAAWYADLGSNLQCFIGNLMLFSDIEFTVTYKIVTYNSETNDYSYSEVKTVDNPLVICGKGDPLIRVDAKDKSQSAKLYFYGVFNTVVTDDLMTFGVFTTQSSLDFNFPINKARQLNFVAVNKNQIKLQVINGEGNSYRLFNSETQSYFDSERGNDIRVRSESENTELSNFTIKISKTSDESVSELTAPYKNDLFYIIPTEGSFTEQELLAYTKTMKSSLYLKEDEEEDNKGNDDDDDKGNKDDDDDNKDKEDDNNKDKDVLFNKYIAQCKEQQLQSPSMNPKSTVFSIEAGKYQCINRDYAFASKDKFIVEMYNISSNETEPTNVSNPFSILGGSPYSIIKCTDNTKGCKVHAITIYNLGLKGEVHHIFTTKSSLDTTQDVKISKDSAEYFVLTVHGSENRKVSVAGDSDDVFYELYNSENAKKGSELTGKTIAALPFMKEGADSGEGKFIIEISKAKSSSAEASESLFEKDLIYEIPHGIKTETEVQAHSKNSKIGAVNGSDKGGPGVIIGIVVAVIIVIIIICVLVWFFVFRKKSDDKKDSGSGEKA
ncbi:hypothetical protein TVAG_477130 [Trichomonas vaginalis G3]|uniref:Uncharacterized protein n=1 Tax=Trichomonas vaginalis (strain ATCC PRA-98 / G3) TaxID=412133 RepID=A2DAD6_TRIV3|nr:glycoprotein 38 family [Trichomonas vaginalis G3]EAY22784.1 hypothetical protein TVAG_477130 [Trichomonas vaginalis G3]KAI5525595.1 glycoprotein 38 family [Trichomonas vaginalis G3]|eukprot:XP_001583770.1 hypothetical protein [Trichomonas vaginalis G3]